MPYCHKEEYAVYDADDYAFAWYDEFDEAVKYANGQATAVKIVRMRHYSTEHDDVWTAEGGLVENGE